MRIRGERRRARGDLGALAAGTAVMSFAIGWSMAGEGGFRLNRGILHALNQLLSPNGYDREGTWAGHGSGLAFSLEWSGLEEDTAWLLLRTPGGAIEIPYLDPMVRYSGTGNFWYTLTEPLRFESADDGAEIEIFSERREDGSVGFSGAGLTLRHPSGAALQISAAPDAVKIVAGDRSWSFGCDSGSWTMADPE